MSYKSLYVLMKMAYDMFIRDYLLKLVDDPNSDWDNVLMDIVDKIFKLEVKNEDIQRIGS